MELYFIPFLLALGLSLLLALFFVVCAPFLSFVRTPKGSRHLGAADALRLGGIAIGGTFLVTLFFDQHLVIDAQTSVFLIGVCCLMAVGFLDDFFRLSWWVQMVLQVSIGIFVVLYGIRIDFLVLPILGLVDLSSGFFVYGASFITIVWFLIIINALNWSDGLDGLAGGVTVIAATTLFVLALRPEVYQPPLAIISIVLAGAVLGFTLVNIFTGKIIAGTSGSYVMGFIIAVLAIFAGAKIGTALLVLIVPLVDAFFVIIKRLQKGESIFAPDAEHLHHRLRAMGWSVKKILTMYYGLTIVGACLALSMQSVSKVIVLCAYGMTVLFILYIITNKSQNKNS